MSANSTEPSTPPRQAPWEALIQGALNLGFRTIRRRLVRARHSARHSGTSARQLHDLGLSHDGAGTRTNVFVQAEAQLGMVR